MRILARLEALCRAISTYGASTLEAIAEAIAALFGGDRETRRNVAFSVAMIALSAKMAKADGVVKPEEVAAFQQIFSIPPEEMRNVFRLYNLAKQDTAGFDAYARRLAVFCREEEGDHVLLEDVLDGLFHISKADSVIHDREIGFLEQIAVIFGLSESEFRRILARHVGGAKGDPFAVLGVEPTDSLETVRRRYLTLVRENHPDSLTARGVPDEFVSIATERMKAINAAFETIKQKRAA